jgi:O-antigen/teichoic acid export membrane protein
VDLLDSEQAGPAAVRGGLLRLVGYLTGVTITVASAAVLFRHLGVDDAGRYVLVLSTVTLAAGLTDAGLSTIGVRELSLAKGPERATLMSSLLGLRVLFTLIGISGACLYAAVAGLGGRLVAGTAIAGAGVLVTNLQNAYATSLMAKLRLGWVTALDLLRQALTAVMIVALALAGAALLPFFAVAAVAALVPLVVTAALVRGDIPLVPGADRRAWAELLRQTLPFALATAVGALYFRLAILLVELLSTPHETGLFGVSFRIVEVLIIVPQLTISAALPIFSRAARDDRQRLDYGLGLVVESTVMLAGAVAIALIAGASIAIDVVAGDGFDGAVPVLRLHAVALVFSFFAAPWSYALLSLRRHRDLLAMNGLALVVLGIGLALLVSDHGARGAAAATIAGEAVLALSGMWFALRAGVAPRLGRLPRIAAAAALAAVPAVLLPAFPGTAAALAVYVGALLALRAVPDELLHGVLRR